MLDLCADDNSALARYLAAEFTGPGFTGTEHFTFTGDQIAHVEVYFGRDLT